MRSDKDLKQRAKIFCCRSGFCLQSKTDTVCNRRNGESGGVQKKIGNRRMADMLFQSAFAERQNDARTQRLLFGRHYRRQIFFVNTSFVLFAKRRFEQKHTEEKFDEKGKSGSGSHLRFAGKTN